MMFARASGAFWLPSGPLEPKHLQAVSPPRHELSRVGRPSRHCACSTAYLYLLVRRGRIRLTVFYQAFRGAVPLGRCRAAAPRSPATHAVTRDAKKSARVRRKPGPCVPHRHALRALEPGGGSSAADVCGVMVGAGSDAASGRFTRASNSSSVSTRSASRRLRAMACSGSYAAP